MEASAALSMLKVDLGFLSPAPEVLTYMEHLLSVAEKELDRKGIVLDNADPADVHLKVMYAAWLYRKRDTGAGMPRMLEYALRNAQVRSQLNREVST